MTQAPVIGYACTCGFKTDEKKRFVSHFGLIQRDGRDAHRSRGRINLVTGEIVMPPYTERTPEQHYKVKHPERISQPNSDVLTAPVIAVADKKDGKKAQPDKVAHTDLISAATQIRFIPRVFTCSLTPSKLTCVGEKCHVTPPSRS